MTTSVNRTTARMLEMQADCLRRGMTDEAMCLRSAADGSNLALKVGHSGHTWAEFQCASWRPYRSEYAQMQGWAYAILYVVSREESDG